MPPLASEEYQTFLPSREKDGWMSLLSPKVSWTLRDGSCASTMKIFSEELIRRLYRICVPSGDQAGLPS